MINSQTKICAVIGHPIKHSLSPIIHNVAYKKTNQNYVYVALDFIKVCDAITAMKLLDIKQFAVTIPHKIEIINFLDIVDPLAKKIQSVNTVINKDGKLYGYNTDIYGIEMTFKKNRVDLKNKKVVMIGAGGVARSIGMVIKKNKGVLTILDITGTKSSALAKLLKCQSDKVENLEKYNNYDILINATPVGMSPETQNMPVPKSFIKKKKVIFDVIYNPQTTALLKEGKKNGCKCINGAEMFIEQAAKQFELLTGKRAPIKIMMETFLKNIK